MWADGTFQTTNDMQALRRRRPGSTGRNPPEADASGTET